MVTFHWLSYVILPLAELLLVQGESFLPLAEMVKYYHVLSKMQGMPFPAGVSRVCGVLYT